MSRAVIWDMDGVLVDSGPHHFRAWQRVAEEIGRTFDEADFTRTFGMRSPEVIRSTFGPAVPAEQVAFLCEHKEEIFRALSRSRIAPLPGAIRLLSALKTAGYLQALASSAPIANVEMMLTSLAVREVFDAIVSEKDVRRGKPDPEVFLVAARKLKVSPAACIVIEDAVPGVEAAKAAGMACIAVSGSNLRPDLAQADLAVESLEAVDVETVESLFPEPATPPAADVRR